MRCPTHFLLVGLLAISPLLGGCSGLRRGAKVVTPGPRAFDFATDTLALLARTPVPLENQEPLSESGLSGHRDAAVARQFFLHASFDPAQSPPTTARRLALVREVLGRKSDGLRTGELRVVIPGYANLREFSRLQGHLIRAESWLLCPCEARTELAVKAFGRGGEQKVKAVRELAGSLAANRPAVVRLYQQRVLKYDRSLLVFGAQERDGQMVFDAYDPAVPDAPVQLRFNQSSREFALSDDAAASSAALGVEIHRRR